MKCTRLNLMDRLIKMHILIQPRVTLYKCVYKYTLVWITDSRKRIIK